MAISMLADANHPRTTIQTPFKWADENWRENRDGREEEKALVRVRRTLFFARGRRAVAARRAFVSRAPWA